MEEQLQKSLLNESNADWKDWITCFIYFGIMLGQVVITILFYKAVPSNALQWVGWILLWSTAIFGQLPVWTFKKYGKGEKGKSYIHTNQLVDKGIYSIMRHPQYFSWFLITLGLTFLNQQWYSYLMSGICFPLIYWDIIKEDKQLIKKFGQTYKNYMERVPRINFIAGIYRKITHSN